MSTPSAAVLAIGDELIAGRYHDRNSGAISAVLERLGIEVRRFLVLGDDEAALAEALGELASRHRVVISTGGLGPTLDDVTREAAATAAGRALERHEDVVAWLRGWFAERGRPMPEANERQACFPAGATVLPNRCGTAPGFLLQLGDCSYFALPGPPAEMQDMLSSEVLPRLSELPDTLAVADHGFHLVGLGESDFADRAGAWMERSAEPRMGVTSHTGVLSVTLRALAGTPAEARAMLERRRAEFLERFGEHVYSEDGDAPAEPDLAVVVGRALIEHGISLVTAESCTGGLLAERLTAVPGISAVYPGGWITYSNAAKRRELGVPAELLERHGAVSGEVAAAMAAGAARESGARLAVALTGVAGPDGGTADKPVGLVWLGLAVDGRVTTRELRLPPVGRAAVRTFAVHAALDAVRRALAELAPPA